MAGRCTAPSRASAASTRFATTNLDFILRARGITTIALGGEEHDNAIKFDYPMFSTPMSAEDFTADLAGAKEPA